MSDQQKPLSIWVDDSGDFSMGRLIAFFGAFVGITISIAGATLSFLEVITKTNSAQGVALVGIGVGLFTSGALLKGWQKQAEVQQSKGTP